MNKRSSTYPVLFMLFLSILFGSTVSAVSHLTSARVEEGKVARLRAKVLAAFSLEAPADAEELAGLWKSRIREHEKEGASYYAALGEEGGEALLSDDRRRLSECMFLGGLIWQDIAVWNPDPWPENHHELVASLMPGDERPMILAVMSREAGVAMAKHFEEAHEIEIGTFRTHADRSVGYSIWFVQGFRGY